MVQKIEYPIPIERASGFLSTIAQYLQQNEEHATGISV